MVLIIRNNRIQSSRHSRFKTLLSCVTQKDKAISSKNEKKDLENIHEAAVMSEALVLGYLLIFSTAMFTLPFAVFFGVRHIMDQELHSDIFMTNCVSVLSAVITVNMIIAAYAYLGFQEPDDPSDNLEERTDSKEDLNKKEE